MNYWNRFWGGKESPKGEAKVEVNIAITDEQRTIVESVHAAVREQLPVRLTKEEGILLLAMLDPLCRVPTPEELAEITPTTAEAVAVSEAREELIHNPAPARTRELNREIAELTESPAPPPPDVVPPHLEPVKKTPKALAAEKKAKEQVNVRTGRTRQRNSR